MVDDIGGAEAVRNLLQSPKYEMLPLKSATAQIEFLPDGATVTVTASPVKGPEPTLELAAELATRGYPVITHLAARSVADEAHLSRIVEVLDADDLDRVFLVGGDAKEPGEYPDALSLIKGFESVGATFSEIGIGAYPDGHAFIPDDALAQALADKQPHASYMTTQMCFDATLIDDWVSESRADGITLPLHIGIPGVAEFQKLIRISAQIGVGQSARFLSKSTGLFRRLAPQSNYTPDKLIADLVGVITDPAAEVQALHFYTFNQIETLEAWRRRWLAVLDG